MQRLCMGSFVIVIGLRQRVGLVYLGGLGSVRLTDRMFDVAHLLRHYIPDHQWRQWLRDYGYKYNQTVLDKLYWYGQYSYLNQIKPNTVKIKI